MRVLQLRNRHFFVLDLFLLALTPVAALALRLDGLARIPRYLPLLIYFTLFSLIVKMSVSLAEGLYRRFWRYASIEEMVLILESTGTGALVIILFFFATYSKVFAPLPRSVPFIDFLLTVGAVAIPRFLIRCLSRWRSPTKEGARRVLVVGAGDAGQLLAQEMRQNPTLGLDLVGFVDDDQQKQGLQLRGAPVLGGRDRIPELVREYKIQQVIIAIPSAPGHTIREIVEICNETGVETRILPGFADMLNGDVSLRRVRSVRINDLLRREPVKTDTTAVAELIRGRRVLVTGAGGSIGSELCRQVWRFGPAQLVLLGHGENSIFNIYHELSGRGPGVDAVDSSAARIVPVIADIRFPERVSYVFEQYRPEIVFHAAAHKHVPLMELNPSEAITNNVFGTRIVLQASMQVGVERFVMISTDKAVNPTSIMGASKRLAEYLVLQAAEESSRPYVVVRFGNVLGSRGSVVLTFQRQIAQGGPVTVTHPEMRRFFMTIPEAVQLVLQAAVLGKGGEIFVLDMGEPIKIVDLAKDLIELSGLRVGKDIEIQFTGIRPGEKLFEELFVPGENYERTLHEKIFVATKSLPPGLDTSIRRLEKAALLEDYGTILEVLSKLTPDFQPSNTVKMAG